MPVKNPALDLETNWSYSPAPQSSTDVKLRERYELFINGEFSPAETDNYMNTINPATEEKLAEVPQAGAADVDHAVAAARNAYTHVWSRMPAAERGKFIFRIARMIQERARELAVTESLDGGKPIREARDIDTPLAAAHFFYYAGWADKMDYAFPGRSTEPLGVAAQIIPWNFPLLMAAWKLAPALAAGNTLVLKPAETTPLTAMILAEIVSEAGLPPGVVNIITGGSETGQLLVRHPDVDKIAFTGSTAVGKEVHYNSACCWNISAWVTNLTYCISLSLEAPKDLDFHVYEYLVSRL